MATHSNNKSKHTNSSSKIWTLIILSNLLLMLCLVPTIDAFMEYDTTQLLQRLRRHARPDEPLPGDYQQSHKRQKVRLPIWQAENGDYYDEQQNVNDATTDMDMDIAQLDIHEVDEERITY